MPDRPTEAAESAVPVLVVGLGSDSTGDPALAVALDLAQRLGAHLHVVHVVSLEDHPVDPDAADWEEQARQAVAVHRHQVADQLADAEVGWDYETRHGEPAVELAAVADERAALYIIVGTRGEGPLHALSRLLRPSVSHAVIGHRHRPILVVPTPDNAADSAAKSQ
jgi:nucleotide-binding universal stress UspA family protein